MNIKIIWAIFVITFLVSGALYGLFFYDINIGDNQLIKTDLQPGDEIVEGYCIQDLETHEYFCSKNVKIENEY